MSEASPRRRTQFERRTQAEESLLEAARELIDEQGVRAVTFAAVAARAGYSRGIITHHFGNRSGLMEALARSLQDVVAVAPTPLTGRERVLARVDLYVEALQQHPRDTRVFSMLWAEAIAGDLDLRRIFGERDAEFRRSFADCLRSATGESLIDGVDPETAGMAIVGQLRGISMQLVLIEAAPDFTALRQTIAQLLGSGLR